MIAQKVVDAKQSHNQRCALVTSPNSRTITLRTLLYNHGTLPEPPHINHSDQFCRSGPFETAIVPVTL